MKKSVSIIIPTYNGQSRGFLAQAIESVLSQTYANFELILIDDGSTDATSKLCKNYCSDKRVKYVFQENSGVSAARNNGIAQSSGEYVCFLDDDDVWANTKLEEQINFINNLGDKKFGLCFTGLEIIDKNGKHTGSIQNNFAHGDMFIPMLCENLVNCTSSVIIPRKVLLDIGGFKEHLAYAEDYDLFLRIAKKYNLYSLNKILVFYREHNKNVSSNLDKIDFYAQQVVSEALLNQKNINKNLIFIKFYQKRAAYRFWLGDYKVFRKYVKLSGTYGPVGVRLRWRLLCSYCPWLVKFVRGVKGFLSLL
jgi:glycosyltransferase involved in cell wall biosynthesis